MTDKKKADIYETYDSNTDPFAWVNHLPPMPPLSMQKIRPEGSPDREIKICILTYDRIPDKEVDGVVEAFRQAIERANRIYDEAQRDYLEKQKRRNESDRNIH